MPRVLVVGAGPAAQALHLPILAKLRDERRLNLLIVCDLQRDRAQAARKRFGFLEDTGDALAALERPDVDVVYLFGSAQVHHEYGLRALTLGKHLFVEKPVAPGFTQTLELVRLAQSRGLVAVGGLNRRFLKSLAEVRSRAGETRWRFAEAVFHKPEFGATPPFGARTWLSANGIHALDALLHVMGGPPEHLFAQAGERSARYPGAFSALMRWNDGAQGVFLCNNDAGSRRESYVFHGVDETLSVDAEGLTIERKGSPATRLRCPMLADGFVEEHDAFLEAIRLRFRPPHCLSLIAPSVQLAELIESGFAGAVPVERTAVNLMPPKRHAAGRTVLVIQSGELHAALATLLPSYRLVCLEDVTQGTVVRPDIVAAILGRGASSLSAEVLDKLPNLGVVGIVGLSVARFDPEALAARGIRLLNARHAYAHSVAEYTLGLAILGRRRAFVSHALMTTGGWGSMPRIPGIAAAMQRAARALRPILRRMRLETTAIRAWKAANPRVVARGHDAFRPHDLRGATVGLIGWGANACALAERLHRVPARVLVHSAHAHPAEIRQTGAIPASLGEVLAADVICVHRGLTAETRHSIGTPELDRLRSGTVLINVARGALIEPVALLNRLRRGDIFACLDTFEEEPLPASHPLRRLPNVFLTSHIAGGTPENYADAALEVVGKIADYLAGDASEILTDERLRTMS